MKKKAFTLIEILSVIIIFGVGILAVLTLLTNSVGYFDTINMQTRATLLAKEALDLTFHYRDTNIEQGYPRNYVTYNENKGEMYIQPNQSYKVGFSNAEETYLELEMTDRPTDFDSAFETFFLEMSSDATDDFSTYHYLTDQKIQEKKEKADFNKGFARRVEFSAIKDENGNPIPNLEKKLLKISAHTLYKRGASTGEVILESFI